MSHDNCLIVDKGINFGSEFFGEASFKYEPKTEQGEKLLKKAAKSGSCSCFLMQAILAKTCFDEGCEILLETTAFGSFAKKDSDIITLFAKSGLTDVHADRVIDTTSLGSLNYLANDKLRLEMCKKEDYISKYVCASTENGFLKMRLPLNISYDEGILALCDSAPSK